MCCFSRAVPFVASTKIFARPLDGDLQALAYAMDFAATEDLALVLPIPTPLGAADDAVTFVDLSSCRDFFARLESAFPQFLSASEDTFQPQSFRLRQAPPLVVHDVGDFEASFVPSVADFGRLDARFRLPESVWDSLPVHRTYGFVVAKLRATKSKTLHPLAFTFPRRDPSRVFFPTVHVHDGAVHPTATFDHSLFVQASTVPSVGTDPGDPTLRWEHAIERAGAVMDAALGAGLVHPADPIARAVVVATRTNDDISVAAG